MRRDQFAWSPEFWGTIVTCSINGICFSIIEMPEPLETFVMTFVSILLATMWLFLWSLRRVRREMEAEEPSAMEDPELWSRILPYLKEGHVVTGTRGPGEDWDIRVCGKLPRTDKEP